MNNDYDLKRCCQCEEEKYLIDFPPHRLSKDGRIKRCRKCSISNRQATRLKWNIFCFENTYRNVDTWDEFGNLDLPCEDD